MSSRAWILGLFALVAAVPAARAGVHVSATVDLEVDRGSLAAAPRTRVVVTLQCAGAQHPRLGWGQTTWRYRSSMQHGEGVVEAPGVRIGAGEVDAATQVLRSDWTTFAGAVVVPVLEQATCFDLDHKGEQDHKVDVHSPTAYLPPVVTLLGFELPEQPGVPVDPAALPADRALHPVFTIDAHPSGRECVVIEVEWAVKGGASSYLPWLCAPGHASRYAGPGPSPIVLSSVDAGAVMPPGVTLITPAMAGKAVGLRMRATMLIDEQPRDDLPFVVLASTGGAMLPLAMLTAVFDALPASPMYERTGMFLGLAGDVRMPSTGGTAPATYLQTTLGPRDTDRVRDADALASADPTRAKVGTAYVTRGGIAVKVTAVTLVASPDDHRAQSVHVAVTLTNGGTDGHTITRDQLHATFVNGRGVEKDHQYGAPLEWLDANGQPVGLSLDLAPGATTRLEVRFLLRMWANPKEIARQVLLGVEDLVLAYDTAKLRPAKAKATAR